MTAIGIDLGTTNSAAAVVEGEEAEIIEIEAERTLRSVLTFAERVKGQEEVIVGDPDFLESDPETTVSAVKRHMGEEKPYSFDSEDLEYTPEMLSGLILKKVLQEAESELTGVDNITDAVITVPARFSEAARSCTEAAAHYAYLDNVQMLLPEPSAACVAYKVDDESDDVERAAVYDLGGGTFDISIVNIVPDEASKNKYIVERNDGRQQLGGENFDERLQGWLIEQFEADTGIDLDDISGEQTPHEAKMRVKAAAKDVKEKLSKASEKKANVPAIAEGENLKVDVTREKFEELTEDLVEETIDICEGVLDDLGYDPSDIDTVLTVGGSTKMPQVQEAVEDFFGQEPIGGVNPDLAVALGAGEQADSMRRRPPATSEGDDTESGGELPSPDKNELPSPDVHPQPPGNIGFELADGSVEVLIEEGMTLPAEIEEGGYTTVEDYQDAALVRIFRVGDSEEASKDVEHPSNTHIKTFELENIREAKAGEPDLKVRFEMDVNGIVRAEAWDTSIGERAKAESIEVGTATGSATAEDGPYRPPPLEEIEQQRDKLPPVK